MNKLGFALLKVALGTCVLGACSDSKPTPVMPPGSGAFEAGTSPITSSDAAPASDSSTPADPTPDAAAPRHDAAVLPTSDAGSSPTPVAPNCSGPGLAPGLVTWNDVQARAVMVYVPPGLDATKPVPVVIVLHGHLVPIDQMPAITHIQQEADANGFIALFPSGVLGTWNTGGAKCGLGTLVSGVTDDIGYIEAVLKRLGEQQCIDRSRVYAMGFSMGGYLANSIACHRPDLVRAVAAHSAGRPVDGCMPGLKPVIIVHGTKDGTISFDCGTQARDLWVAQNGCSKEVDMLPIKGGHCEVSRGCPVGGEVEFCILDGMGHGWAGSTNGFANGGAQYEDATELIWQFFKKTL